MDAVVQDDGVPSPQEQQPKTKRRLSRLQHMTVNKQAASPSKDQELRHKVSPAAKPGFSMPELDNDTQDDVLSQPQQLDALPAHAGAVNDMHSSQQTSAQAQANSVGANAFVAEPPTTTAPAAASPEPTKASTTELNAAAETAGLVVSAAVAAAPKPVRLQDSDLDEDDDDWEDQPAPLIPEDSIEEHEPLEAAVAAAAPSGDGAVQAYDPTNRRRAQYDDEDEWEQLLQKEKHAGTQAASGAESQGHELHAQQGSVSVSGSASDQGDSDDDGDNILADDPDAVNASTQRVLRDVSANDCLGKGFKPQVAPLNSLLGKLAARQAALEAKAKRGPATAHADAEAAAQPQPALTLEQLKAHLEQHSLGHKQPKTEQQHQHQQAAGDDATDGAAAADNDNSSKEAAATAGNDMEADDHCADTDVDVDDDLDDLEIEPPQQQQQQQEKQQPGSNMLLPETQEVLDELHHAADAAGTGIISGTEAIAAGSTAPEAGLDLQLDDEEGSDAMVTNADDSEHGNGAGADEQEADSDGEADGEGAEDEEELLNSSDEDMLSEDEESDVEEQQQSSEIEAEPLPWEEEELHNSQQDGAPYTAAAAGDKAAAKVKKSKVVVKRSCAAAGGFVDAEADLSEDEEGQGLDSDDEEDSEDDAMLAELIADVKEGRLDEARRAALHAQWMHGQDGKDINELIDAMKKGFRRKRKQVAGLDNADDDEGNNAAARRRRAELQGIIEAEGEDEPLEGTDRLQRLDLMLADDEGEAEAAAAATAAELANREKQKKIHKLQLQASASQQESDVIQLLSMDVDEASQHTAALLSKSASLAAAGQGAGHITGSDSNLGSLRGIAAAGAAKPGVVAAAGAGLGKGTGLAVGGFTFQMFGKDVTNSSQPKQVAGSFLGRQASSSITVRAASNYGASRSFVFGSDPSNYSNPGLAGHSQQPKEDSRLGAGGAVGPSSFAGLSKLIPEAAAKDASRLAPGSAATKQQGGGSGGSSLLHMLQEKKSGSAAMAGHSILKQHVDAVGAKFKATNSRSRAGDDATSRGAWDF